MRGYATFLPAFSRAKEAIERQKLIRDPANSMPSTHSTGGEKVSHMTGSCLVLERISQVAWTSDKLSKELSLSLFRRD